MILFCRQSIQTSPVHASYILKATRARLTNTCVSAQGQTKSKAPLLPLLFCYVVRRENSNPSAS